MRRRSRGRSTRAAGTAAAIEIRNCGVSFAPNLPDTYGPAIEVHRVRKLQITGFEGEGSHPGRDPARVIE